MCEISIMFVPSQKTALLFDVRRDSPGWFPYGTAALSRALCKQPHLFFECLSLCSSRACLGKMIVFSTKWPERFAFSYLSCETTSGCCAAMFVVSRGSERAKPQTFCEHDQLSILSLSGACLGKWSFLTRPLRFEAERGTIY